MLTLPLLTGACSWLTDFRQQPSIGTWQSTSVTWADTSTPFRGNPQNSVPTQGVAVAGYEVSYARTHATIDSMSGLKNPEAPTQESVDRGWRYFQTSCAPCHGEAAAGNPNAVRFGIPAPSLIEAVTQARSDGYIFGMIRNGRNLMPPMNRIPEHDRWHVVNYLRALQGKVTGVVAKKEPAGLPGETGETLPGPTMNAPTRSAPYAKPTYTPTGGAAAATSHETHKQDANPEKKQ